MGRRSMAERTVLPGHDLEDRLARVEASVRDLERGVVAVKFRRLCPEAVVPKYETAGAAGMDLVAKRAYEIPPGKSLVVGTGIAIELPPGYEAQVRSRSGLSLKGLVVANSPGTVDYDYRGEVGVILQNNREDTYFVERGDRVAQLVLARLVRADLVEVDQLANTERGAGGLGSTGK